MVTRPLIERLPALALERRSHLCVGLDPRPEWFPDELRPPTGADRETVAQACACYCCEVIDLIDAEAVAIKPQSAFFEAHGWTGVRALESVARHARARDLIVLGDVKRGDIGTTAAAYASSVFDPPAGGEAPLYDAVTVNPYLGSDGVEPFLDRAAAAGGGVFVLVKTSNPSSADLQDLTSDGRPVFEHVAAHVRRWTERYAGRALVGAVAGATHPSILERLRSQMPETWLLLPGVGAQGASLHDAAGGFDASGTRALVTVSRSVTFPWLADGGSVPADWRGAIRDAVRRTNGALRTLLAERTA